MSAQRPGAYLGMGQIGSQQNIAGILTGLSASGMRPTGLIPNGQQDLSQLSCGAGVGGVNPSTDMSPGSMANAMAAADVTGQMEDLSQLQSFINRNMELAMHALNQRSKTQARRGNSNAAAAATAAEAAVGMGGTSNPTTTTAAMMQRIVGLANQAVARMMNSQMPRTPTQLQLQQALQQRNALAASIGG